MGDGRRRETPQALSGRSRLVVAEGYFNLRR